MADRHDERLDLGPLTLLGGATLPEVTVAYAHYGRLAPDGRNAILVGHGYTANHRMLAHGEGVAEGSWAPLIGPGRPLDTERFFIVCSNMLGSCYGTTGPASIDPASGRPYGADFPAITLADIVEVQHRLLQRLGVRHLRAVVGPSFGGFQALQWGLDHPDFVDALGVVLSAPCMPDNEHGSLAALEATFAQDPAWGATGHGVGNAEVGHTLRQLRLETMRTYGGEAVLAARGLGPAERAARAQVMAEQWAREFDPHALFVLLKAARAFDARERLGALRADLLYVISDTDLLFPPDPATQALMMQTATGRRRCYVQMHTDFGHMASGAAAELWAPALAELLA